MRSSAARFLGSANIYLSITSMTCKHVSSDVHDYMTRDHVFHQQLHLAYEVHSNESLHGQSCSKAERPTLLTLWDLRYPSSTTGREREAFEMGSRWTSKSVPLQVGSPKIFYWCRTQDLSENGKGNSKPDQAMRDVT